MNRFLAFGWMFVVSAISAASQTNSNSVAPAPPVPEATVVISVHGLHADFSTADAADLERKLTLLLESRLSSIPGYVVLERRHAGSQPPPAPPSLPQGNYVVDGNIIPPLPGDTDVVVHLRLRSPAGKETPLDVHGAVGDPNALVEQMAAAIQKATGAAPAGAAAWQPQQEAREYLQEGIWGAQHKADDSALDALDTAEWLGETAPDLLAVRVPILCRHVLATDDPSVLYNGAPIKDDSKPDEKIAYLKRAISDEAQYEKEGGEGKLQLLDHYHTMDGRTGDLHKMVDRTGSQLLVMLERTNQPQVGDVRTALRDFAGYDPLHGKLPGDWENAIDFADDWATSKEEEIAYYRGVMTTPPYADYGAWRLSFRLSPDNFCAGFIPAPADRSAAYFALFEDLSHDPVAAPLSLYYLATHATPDKKDAACHALYDYIWDNHEKLGNAGHLLFILKYAWVLEKSRNVTVADPKLVSALHYFFQTDKSFTGLEAQMWLPELFPKDEAPGLLADLQGYEKRDVRAQHNHVYREMESAYYDRFGGGPNAGPELPALDITRFWFPKDVPRRLILGMGALTPVPDGLWLAGEIDGEAGGVAPQGVLYHLTFDSSKPSGIADAPAPIATAHASIQNVVAMPGNLYVLELTSDQPSKTVVDHYDLTTKQWDECEVPGADQLFAAGGQLYVSLKGLDFNHREGGLARYDGKTGAVTVLASSRRRPAQNQFDDCPDYRVTSIFTGPGNKPCATIQFNNYYIQDTPGKWEPLTNAGLLMHARTEDTRTLLYGAGSFKSAWDAAALIDPAKTEPELWLGPVEPMPEMHTPGGAKPPLPPLPAWAATPLWTQSESADLQAGDYGFHGSDLFALKTTPRSAGKVQLVWYQKGRPDPVRIPLHFKISDDANKALTTALGGNNSSLAMVAQPEKTPYVLMMTVVPQGICFKGLFQGFWFVPFADIEAYLKKNASPKTASATP